MPPLNTHSHRGVSAMPSDVNAVDELDLPDLDSPEPQRARRRGSKGEQTRRAVDDPPAARGPRRGPRLAPVSAAHACLIGTDYTRAIELDPEIAAMIGPAAVLAAKATCSGPAGLSAGDPIAGQEDR